MNLRTEKDNFVEEITQLRRESVEMREALNMDRSKRLKLMHLNETLQSTNEELLQQNKACVAGKHFVCNYHRLSLTSRLLFGVSEANSARKSLFEKLTQLEITVSTRDAQRLTIQAQAEEMVSLTKEVAQLKEDCFALTRRVHA